MILFATHKCNACGETARNPNTVYHTFCGGVFNSVVAYRPPKPKTVQVILDGCADEDEPYTQRKARKMRRNSGKGY